VGGMTASSPSGECDEGPGEEAAGGIPAALHGRPEAAAAASVSPAERGAPPVVQVTPAKRGPLAVTAAAAVPQPVHGAGTRAPAGRSAPMAHEVAP
jgi:hypothetical protein